MKKSIQFFLFFLQFVVIRIFCENGILRHSLAGVVIFISLQHFIAPALDLMPCLPSGQKEGGNKGIKSKKGAIILLVWKYSVLGNFLGQNTFSKIVALIVKESQIRYEVYKKI